MTINLAVATVGQDGLTRIIGKALYDREWFQDHDSDPESIMAWTIADYLNGADEPVPGADENGLYEHLVVAMAERRYGDEGWAHRISDSVVEYLRTLCPDLDERLESAATSPRQRAMSVTYRVAWSNYARLFVATTEDFPGITAFGSSAAGALERAQLEVAEGLEAQRG